MPSELTTDYLEASLRDVDFRGFLALGRKHGPQVFAAEVKRVSKFLTVTSEGIQEALREDPTSGDVDDIALDLLRELDISGDLAVMVADHLLENARYMIG